MKIRLLVNPNAGAGRSLKCLPEIKSEFERHGAAFELCMTEGPQHAQKLAAQAREDGAELLAVVGGDGTFNEALQGYLGQGGEVLDGPDLGIIPAGTGGDFRRTFDLSLSIPEAIARLLTSAPRRVDVGVAEVTGPSEGMDRRAFINVLSFGVGGLTDKIVNEGPKWLGGRASFLLGALRATFAYKNQLVRLELDGAEVLESPIYNVALCNGRYFGGGMMIGPNADPSDGLLDVVVMGDLGKLASVALTGSIYRGAHVDAPGVLVRRAQRIIARPLRSQDQVLIDLDGETPGQLPLSVEVAAGAVRLRI